MPVNNEGGKFAEILTRYILVLVSCYSQVVLVIVGLIALSHYTLAAPVEETSGRSDLNSAPSERCKCN